MPEVKGKKYPYTPEGVAAAEEAKRSTFTLKSGNSPLFKMMGSGGGETEGEYVDDPSGAAVLHGKWSNTRIDNIKKQISAHQKIQTETKPWGTKMDILQNKLLKAKTELAESKGLDLTIT